MMASCLCHVSGRRRRLSSESSRRGPMCWTSSPSALLPKSSALTGSRRQSPACSSAARARCVNCTLKCPPMQPSDAAATKQYSALAQDYKGGSARETAVSCACSNCQTAHGGAVTSTCCCWEILPRPSRNSSSLRPRRRPSPFTPPAKAPQPPVSPPALSRTAMASSTWRSALHLCHPLPFTPCS